MAKDKSINLAELVSESKEEFRRKALANIEISKEYLRLVEEAGDHMFLMCSDADYHTKPQYLTTLDEGYQSPTGDDVKKVVSQIRDLGYTKPDIAKLLGVSPTKNRTIDRWCGSGDEKSRIPYAAWRLLLSFVGKAITLQLKEKQKP